MMGMKCSNDNRSCWPHCLKIAVLAVLGLAALGAIVMSLWNCLMPALFSGVQTISFWQALGVLLLSKILFGGFGCGGGHRHWRERQQQWAAMTPEERAQLKGSLKSRWGRCGNSPRAEGDAAKDIPPTA